MSNPFLLLDNSIVQYCLQFVPYYSLPNAMYSCKLFKKLIEDGHFWLVKTRIEIMDPF